MWRRLKIFSPPYVLQNLQFQSLSLLLNLLSCNIQGSFSRNLYEEKFLNEWKFYSIMVAYLWAIFILYQGTTIQLLRSTCFVCVTISATIIIYYLKCFLADELIVILILPYWILTICIPRKVWKHVFIYSTWIIPGTLW